MCGRQTSCPVPDISARCHPIRPIASVLPAIEPSPGGCPARKAFPEDYAKPLYFQDQRSWDLQVRAMGQDHRRGVLHNPHATDNVSTTEQISLVSYVVDTPKRAGDNGGSARGYQGLSAPLAQCPILSVPWPNITTQQGSLRRAIYTTDGAPPRRRRGAFRVSPVGVRGHEEMARMRDRVERLRA